MTAACYRAGTAFLALGTMSIASLAYNQVKASCPGHQKSVARLEPPALIDGVDGLGPPLVED